ncbi:MFS transporter [Nocardioides sp. DS6]|uniref:MFS transporter n=1 Tax=Nocardioides eburneus TaxID=3231482 RepID=A0ABV3T0G5_9ACTN
MTRPSRRARTLLALASVAVAFAAADTYVVVLALPDMMAGVGLSVEQLQRAAPVVSGFLLGYVAMLPLIGRIADVRGRLPVLVAGLVVFAAGSLVTAAAYDLASMVVGRFFQGLGGGALVPATMALVADLYPVERRGVPLGLVSAVQELGSVLGPLGGAVVLALADWRGIFVVNLVVGVVLALAIRRLGAHARPEGPAESAPMVARVDPIGVALLIVMLVAAALVVIEPTGMMRDVTWGRLFIPQLGSGRWTTPLGLVAIVAAAVFLERCATARRPLLDLRGWLRSARDVDLLGAFLLAVVLGGIILAFATADPSVQVISAQGVWYLLAAALAAVALGVHLRHARDPLVPVGTLRRTPAWGSVLVSFLVGAALVAALIDIPLFARTTIYGDSQLKAALVLLRFLVALPVGAVAGGYLTRRVPAGAVAGAGLLLAALGFVWMTRWDVDSLAQAAATLPLVVGGLGFGLALAPVNAAVLATTDSAVHGVASSLVVVARMVGMLVGISGLTTLGLRRYYAEQADLPPLREVCSPGAGLCREYSDLLQRAGIAQEHTVFAGAAVAALAGAVLAVVLFRGAPTREVDTREALSAVG